MFDWALTEHDRCNEVVRFALNLDRVSEDGEHAGASNSGDVCLKKFYTNEMEIIEIKKRLKILEA